MTADEPATDENSAARDNVLLDAWKTVVDVQQHFNDLELRVRSLAVTTVGVLLGAVGFAVRDDLRFDVLGGRPPAAAFLILVAVIALGAFWMMDGLWYHRLLLGAVEAGQPLETALGERYPEIQLGRSISKRSPFTLWSWVPKYGGTAVHSTAKLHGFYIVFECLLLALLVGFLVAVKPVPSSAAIAVASPTTALTTPGPSATP